VEATDLSSGDTTLVAVEGVTLIDDEGLEEDCGSESGLLITGREQKESKVSSTSPQREQKYKAYSPSSPSS
jgi:hypothetical protein